MSDESESEAMQLLAAFPDLKILPGDLVPKNAEFHICTRHPIMSQVNQQGICDACGSTVYFQDDHGIKKKLCIPCVLEKSKTRKMEAYGNEAQILAAIRHHDRKN